MASRVPSFTRQMKPLRNQKPIDGYVNTPFYKAAPQSDLRMVANCKKVSVFWGTGANSAGLRR